MLDSRAMNGSPPRGRRGWPLVFGLLFLGGGLVLLARQQFLHIVDFSLRGTNINIGWMLVVFGLLDLAVAWRQGSAGSKPGGSPPPPPSPTSG